MDKDAPIVSATVNNNNSTNATITISSNESGTYCVNTSSTATDMSNCTFSGNITKDVSITTSIFTTKGDYYVHVKDNAENIGISNKVSISIGTPIGEYLLQNPSTGLNTSAVYGGMYRYIGTNANNYVKLGDVLYRIIGITTKTDNNTQLGIEANQLKLIKPSTIGNYKWHSTSVNILWNNSDMYKYLQGANVLGNSSIIPSGWSSKLVSIKWNIGDVQTYTNGDTVFDLENNSITSNTSKVGLMYLSDYYYAYEDFMIGEPGKQNCYEGSCNSWLSDSSNNTFTMTRYGQFGNSSYFVVWGLSTINYSYLPYVYDEIAVRPVFYLNKDVFIANPGASGTSTDPFILTY